ncbi:MAG: efflux RND transporter periplasmic adaptor subunit [Candidatus Eremiobacteraeota bacterium]|nr:efflux RND transporter periplasmic adaptor subunit [Candidatus Eremiobacteraeota bacterium]
MNKRYVTLLLVVVGLVAIIAIAGIAGRRGSSATMVHTQTVSYTTFVVKLPENGVIERPQVQSIPAEVSGNLGSVFVRAGQTVSAGQLLATIDNPQILSNAQGAASAYRAQSAHAQSAQASSRTNIAQAQAGLESARARLTQARQDLANGSQSGLGYGGSTAADQKANAQANLENAATNLSEARRIYDADSSLFRQNAISRDSVDQARAKLEQAQVSYNQARQARQSLGSQLSRSTQVLQDNVRSAQEAYAQGQAALSAANVQAGSGDVAAAYADVGKARTDYAYASDEAARTQIRAPFSGTILSQAAQAADALRPLQTGDAVTAGQTLFSISGNSGFIVRTTVDEQDIINVRMGQRANVTGEDFPGKVLVGHVVAISPVAQKSQDVSSTARQVLTTVRLDKAPSFLRDGMSANVDILTTDIRHALVVPNAAMTTQGSKKFVYVAQDGVAHKRAVRTGQSNDSQTVITSGLKLRDQVILSDIGTTIADGQRVQKAPATPLPKRP